MNKSLLMGFETSNGNYVIVVNQSPSRERYESSEFSVRGSRKIKNIYDVLDGTGVREKEIWEPFVFTYNPGTRRFLGAQLGHVGYTKMTKFLYQKSNSKIVEHFLHCWRSKLFEVDWYAETQLQAATSNKDATVIAKFFKESFYDIVSDVEHFNGTSSMAGSCADRRFYLRNLGMTTFKSTKKFALGMFISTLRQQVGNTVDYVFTLVGGFSYVYLADRQERRAYPKRVYSSSSQGAASFLRSLRVKLHKLNSDE